MTNEERARAIRRTWGLNIALAASASKNDLGEACDGLEAAILSALDAATAPLVAERERLREALADIAIYGCGMLNQPIALNGPEEDWLRMRIAQYEIVARSALAEKEPG